MDFELENYCFSNIIYTYRIPFLELDVPEAQTKV